MTRLAANLTMLFNEYPFMDRFEAAARAGFRGVEFLSPYSFHIDQLADKLDRLVKRYKARVQDHHHAGVKRLAVA